NETFSEVSENTGVAYHGIGWGSNFLDYDNDGDLDLYVSGSLEGSDQVPSIMYTNNGTGSFENVDVGFAGDTVISFSNAIGDVDNDGYPDVAVNNFGEYSSMVWRNSGGTNNWIKIQLQGVQSNRDGIGTSIRAYFDNNYVSRYTHCGIGFLAQNSSYEMMGLGESESIDSLIISWPSGHVDKLINLEGNQKIKVIEGATLLPPQIEVIGNNTLCSGDSAILETGFYKSYLWSTGETSRKIKVFNSGNVKVNVEDYAGNTAESATVTILAFDSLQLSFDTTPSSTNSSDGKIKVSVDGGTPPYVYEWDDPGLEMTDLIEDLPPGEYSVTVKDGNGCEVAGTAEVSLLVGLPEEHANLPVRLYPNPASDQIIINSQNIKGKWLEFKMSDLSGKLVKSVYFDAVPQGGDLRINIKNIRSGLYLAEIRNGEKWLRSKIVVNQ
ncbi:MAG: T9SS type A sorting domain-containing protein, partial [Cyclobacteriaceae bacterium]